MGSIVNRLFPQPATNQYTGNPIARLIFILLTIITLVRSLIHILAPDGGAQSIATIPLDTYSAPAADAVIYLFALWGLSQLLMGIWYVIVLWRYASLIPAMYLLIAIEYAIRLLLTEWKPLAITGTAPGAVADSIMVPLALVMLALSLTRASQSPKA